MTDEDFRKQILDDVKEYCGDCVDSKTWENFSRRFYYFAGDFNDDQLYPKIKDRLAQIDRDHSTHQNFFFYMATAPSYFGPIVEKLAANGLMEQNERSLATGDHRKTLRTRSGVGQSPEPATA